MEILRTQNLSFKYPNSNVFAINNVNISINKGEFVVICGESGCGKTTLLKLIKNELAPHGDLEGHINFFGIEHNYEIGYVFQNPESQIVTDKVWHELAFGLENINMPASQIRLRVAEMANYFGISDWFRKDTDKLSGGEKQMLNLASIMVMQPKILILDEPTGQLDPIAATDFITTIQRLNRDFGITIIIAEHRLEQLFPIADRILFMENGKAEAFDTPLNISNYLKNNKMNKALPCAVRIFEELNLDGVCPMTVRECRDILENNFEPDECEISIPSSKTDIALKFDNLWFRYEKNADDILRGINAEIYKEEFICIVGSNGVGKTTLLNVISGLEKPYRGKIKYDRDCKIGYLPQNPMDLFIKDSVYDDLQDYCKRLSLDPKEADKVCKNLGIDNLINRHPHDLSGGEAQKCGLAKVLLNNPSILLLDEPTKGLDAVSKHAIANIIYSLKNSGVSVIAVTHDLEFAAEYADRCGMIFDGEILEIDIPQRFFAQNSFYTTAANRIARNMFINAVTVKDVVEICRKQMK